MTYSPPLEIFDRPTTPLIITRSFPGRYDSLASIGDFVRGMSEKAGLDTFAVYTVEMAVDEACSNIIEHAYQGEDIGPIACTCKISNDGLTIILEDEGQPFDPNAVAPPDLTSSLEDRPTHGLGLHFIRQWMDEVHYEFQPGRGNRLTLHKKRPPAIKKNNTRKR